MIYQKAVETYGKFTNIFFLSKVLSHLSFIILILVALSLVGLLSFWLFPSWYCLECQTSPEECPTNYKDIVLKGALSLCEELTTARPRWEYDQYCKERCRVDVAIAQQDPEICEVIPRLRAGAEARPSLRDLCFIGIAKSLKDTSLCRRAETSWGREECSKDS
ncbi:MAG: hypothetical protein AABY00_00370 [Nanoarchaeota archaeon]